MSNLLDMLVETAPLMNKYLQIDIAISISNTEEYIALFETEKMKFPFGVGTNIRSSGFGDVLDRIARTGESTINYVPKEITGTVPIKAIITPVIENGILLGYYSVSINIEKESNVELSSTQLMESIGLANTSIHKMAESAVQLDEMMHSIEAACASVEESVNEGSKSVQMIQKISTQSNLLGLNAAIEASRVGSAGQGFAIVASEMRKLAEDSKQIAQKVSKALEAIRNSIGGTVSNVKLAKEISLEQNNVTSEISTTMDGIQTLSNILADFAKE